MAELADALVSGTSARKGMGVRLPLSAFESEPRVVGSPASLAIAQDGCKASCDVIQKSIPFFQGKRIAESIGERGKPPSHSCWQRSRPRNHRNVVHMKPSTFKLPAILV